MNFRYMVAVLCLIVAAPFGFAEDYDDLPWELRPYYEFTMAESKVRYAGDNGEWHLEYNGMGNLIQKARMEIELGNGRTFDTSTFGKGSESRSRDTSAQGEGVLYKVNLPIEEAGLSIEHAFFVNTNRAFYLIHATVTNTGTEPVEIKRISPFILPSGSLAALSANVEYRERPLSGRGTWPVYNGKAESLSVGLHDDAKSFHFMIGPVPRGRAASSAKLFKDSTGWSGAVHSEFDPPVLLAPGESIEADPVWTCFAVPSADDVEVLFAWSHAERPRAALTADVPSAWATAEPFASWGNVLEAQRAWSTSGVNYVLIPLGWESKPGSLEGGGSGYPSNMEAAARTIRQGGATPGLTIDPMAAPSGGEAWSARSGDGQLWLNLRNETGFNTAVSNMQKVAAWGFQFYVIPDSLAPDEVLKQFKMTRREAQALGMKVMEIAALGKPVMPSPIGSIGNDAALWREATSAADRMNDYQMPVGPVRLDREFRGGYDRDVLEAMGEYHGPVELVGVPSMRTRSSLAGAFDTNPNARAANQRAVQKEEQELAKADEPEEQGEKKRRFRFRIPGFGNDDGDE